jgi:TP901 family phage tail tape measure protein
VSVGPVATAFVKVVPDATGFRAELEKAVKLAVAQVEKSGAATVRATVTASAAAAAGTGAGATSAAAAGAAAKRATKDVTGLANSSNAARGALIGLSRITPVTVFGLGLYGSAAIVAGSAVKEMVRSTAEFEHSLNVLQATTNATNEEMELIHQTALDLGADLKLPATSANDAATAMLELSKAGLSIEDSLGAARGVLQLAAAAEISAGSAAIYVATALNAFSLAGTEATHIADLLTGASKAAQGSIEDFGLGLNQVSAVSKQVGLDVEGTTGALTELARAGLRGSDGGTSLRTTLLRLAPTTKQAREYMEALGIEIDNTKSIGDQLPQLLDQYRASLQALTPVQQQQALAQIFGQDAIRAASILIRGGSAALEENTRKANEAGAAARLAAANAEGLSGAYAGLKSNLETLGITVGEVVNGPLTAFVTTLGQITGGLIDATNAAIAFGEAVGDLKLPDFLGGGTTADAIKRGLKALPGVGQAAALIDLLPDPEKPPAPFPKRPEEGAGQRSIIRHEKLLERTAKEKEAIRKRIARLVEEGKKPLKGDTTAPVSLETAQLQAQLNDSLQAELAADKAIEAYFEKRLKLAKVGTERYRIILGALASAHSATASVQAQIDSEAAAARAERDRRQKERQAQIEADRKAAAQAAVDAFNLQKSRFELAIQQATTLTPDNKTLIQKAYQNEINFLNARIKHLQNLKKKTRETRQEIVELKSEVLSLKDARDNLTKAAEGGFTIEDLFRAAVENFEAFGGGITGVLDRQGARGNLAGELLGLNPPTGVTKKALDPSTGKPIKSNVDTSLIAFGKQNSAAQARRDNLLLAQVQLSNAYLRILAANKAGKTKLPDSIRDARVVANNVTGA